VKKMPVKMAKAVTSDMPKKGGKKPAAFMEKLNMNVKKSEATTRKSKKAPKMMK